LAQILCIRENWAHTAAAIKIPGEFHTMHFGPTANYPFGEKGRALAGTWKQLDPDNIMAGMLILDGDVAIDPTDLANMLAAIHHHDDQVVVAPAIIWPISTKRGQWTWAHWSDQPSQVLETENIRFFSFNFTYVPRKAIEQAIRDGLASWRFPRVDKRLSDAARKAGTQVYVAENVRPKHLHF
jgi:hypothetical protein